MADSTLSIYNKIIEINNNFPELATLVANDTSNMGLLQTIYYICATSNQLQQQYYDQAKADLQIIRDTSAQKNGKWWQYKVLNYYQYSTNPDFGILNSVAPYYIPYYTSIDNSLNIVKFCSVSSTPNNRNVTIKVAKADSNNLPIQLTTNEINSLKSFVSKMQDPGDIINTVSFQADSIKLDLNIYYNSEYIESNVLTNVKLSINNYFNTLDFDGVIDNQALADAVKSTAGVKSCFINSSFGKSSNSSYVSYKEFYTTQAGYVNLDVTNSIFNLIIK